MSNVLSGSPHFLDDGIQTFLVDGSDRIRSELERHPFVLLSQIETLGLQVRQEPALGLHVGMRHFVASNRLLARDLTYS